VSRLSCLSVLRHPIGTSCPAGERRGAAAAAAATAHSTSQPPGVLATTTVAARPRPVVAAAALPPPPADADPPRPGAAAAAAAAAAPSPLLTPILTQGWSCSFSLSSWPPPLPIPSRSPPLSYAAVKRPQKKVTTATTFTCRCSQLISLFFLAQSCSQRSFPQPQRLPP
jgi:hypothetical protein